MMEESKRLENSREYLEMASTVRHDIDGRGPGSVIAFAMGALNAYCPFIQSMRMFR